MAREMFGYSDQWRTGDATNTSDIDLLVDTAEETSPWFPAGLAVELEGFWVSEWTW